MYSITTPPYIAEKGADGNSGAPSFRRIVNFKTGWLSGNRPGPNTIADIKSFFSIERHMMSIVYGYSTWGFIAVLISAMFITWFSSSTADTRLKSECLAVLLSPFHILNVPTFSDDSPYSTRLETIIRTPDAKISSFWEEDIRRRCATASFRRDIIRIPNEILQILASRRLPDRLYASGPTLRTHPCRSVKSEVHQLLYPRHNDRAPEADWEDNMRGVRRNRRGVCSAKARRHIATM